MASISVRKIKDKTLAALRARATKSGISMEEEIRRVLDRSVEPEMRAGDLMVQIFKSTWDGERLEIPEDDISDPDVDYERRP
jgi:plasmid stability protein